MEIRTFREEDRGAVIELWRECRLIRPQNDPNKDIDRKMAFQPDLFLVAEDSGEVVGAVMVGYEGHRGAINYLAVRPDCQRKGYGRAIMQAAVTKLKALNCPKVNLLVRTSNPNVIEFYNSLGFEMDDVYSLGLRLEFDQPTETTSAG